MKTTMSIHLRKFPVLVEDQRTGEKLKETVTLEKSQLQAAQLVGESSKELIERVCARRGFTVLEAGTPERLAVELDLGGLFELYQPEEEG